MGKFKPGDWAFHVLDRKWIRIKGNYESCEKRYEDNEGADFPQVFLLTVEEAKYHNFGEPPKEKVKKKMYAWMHGIGTM